jgi:hypothetical protein
MSSATAGHISIAVNETVVMSALLQDPPRTRACYVLAHGAGTGIVPLDQNSTASNKKAPARPTPKEPGHFRNWRSRAYRRCAPAAARSEWFPASLRPSCQQIRKSRAAAFVGHVQEINPACSLKSLAPMGTEDFTFLSDDDASAHHSDVNHFLIIAWRGRRP